MDFDKKGVGFGRPPFFCAARFLVSASRPVGYAYSCGIPDTIASAVKSGIACPLTRDGPPPITSFSIPAEAVCPECKIKEERLQVEKFFEDSE